MECYGVHSHVNITRLGCAGMRPNPWHLIAVFGIFCACTTRLSRWCFPLAHSESFYLPTKLTSNRLIQGPDCVFLCLTHGPFSYIDSVHKCSQHPLENYRCPGLKIFCFAWTTWKLHGGIHQ